MIIQILLITSIVVLFYSSVYYWFTKEKESLPICAVSAIIAIITTIILLHFTFNYSESRRFIETYEYTKMEIDNGLRHDKVLQNIVDINNKLRNARIFINNPFIGNYIDEKLLNYEYLTIE